MSNTDEKRQMLPNGPEQTQNNSIEKPPYRTLDQTRLPNARSTWLPSRNFFQRGAKSIVVQISFVMLLFSDQILGRGKSFQGGKLSQGAPLAPLWKKASNTTRCKITILMEGAGMVTLS